MNIVSAPGKLVIIGEYAVLYGAPALVLAVDRRARVKLEYGTEEHRGVFLTAPEVCAETVDLSTYLPPKATTSTPTHLSLVVETLREATSLYSKAELFHASLHITIDSSAFYVGRTKIGLGSSAAVCVALLAALLRHAAGKLPSRQLLFKHALAAHKRFQQGRGSGIDIAASTYGGALLFRTSAEHESPHIESAPEGIGLLNVQTAFVGESTKTSVFVKQVQNAIAHSGDAARAKDALVQLSKTLTSIATPEQLATLIKDFAHGYEELGARCAVDLFSKSHKNAARIARLYGGAYKPSGAGGGDIGFAFFADNNPEQSAELQQAWLGAGLMPVLLHKSYDGFRPENTMLTPP